MGGGGVGWGGGGGGGGVVQMPPCNRGLLFEMTLIKPSRNKASCAGLLNKIFITVAREHGDVSAARTSTSRVACERGGRSVYGAGRCPPRGADGLWKDPRSLCAVQGASVDSSPRHWFEHVAHTPWILRGEMILRTEFHLRPFRVRSSALTRAHSEQVRKAKHV